MKKPRPTREATLSARRDLWHAAGRTAREGRLRRTAQLGLLCSAPVLYVGSLVWHLLAGGSGAAPGQPLAYVLAPAREAYLSGCDACLLGYLLWQWMLLSLLWGFFGGALHRLAAVPLTQGRRESRAAAFTFAREHWRGFAGARIALLIGFVIPIAVACLLAAVGRLDGWLGGVLLALLMLAIVLLVILAVIVGSGCLLGGFLTYPTVACEDSDAFDALSRTFGYAAAGLPRLCLVRLQFGLGVLIGSAWRLLLVGVTVGLVLAVLRLGAGAETMTRIEAILGARGVPFDADRLGVSFGDYLAALALGVAVFVLLLRWGADLVARIACAQCGAYLALREAIDHVATDVLRTKPEKPAFRTADEAGFLEVERVGGD